MAYTGQTIPIPFGQGGILTDEAPHLIPMSNLIKATNVFIRDGVVQRDLGSQRWNAAALPSGIVALKDYWANPGTQYTIAVTREGRVYRFTDPYTVQEITPATTKDSTGAVAPATLTVSSRVQIVDGGQEIAGNPKKLYILTGNDPIQVIESIGTTRRNLTHPAADWSKGQPSFAIVYATRLIVWGCGNTPHFVYGSKGGSQENFDETDSDFFFNNVYPGESDRLVSGFVFKGQLFALKYPKGLYALQVGNLANKDTWFFTRIGGDFGAGSIDAATPVLDDEWIANSDGAITSLTATFSLGNVESASVLKAMKVINYINSQVSPLGIGDRQSIWHTYRKQALFLYRGTNSDKNSFILKFDFNDDNPKLTVVTKDQPNVIALRKGVTLVDELIYGSEDGFIYRMECDDRSVNGASYVSEIQTPHMNLAVVGQNNSKIDLTNDKNFDFIEIEYIPTGGYNLSCDVFIDGNRTETKSFYLGKSSTPAPNQLDYLTLDQARLQGNSTRKQRLKIHGRGRTISLRFYQSGVNQNFKLTGVTVYARPQGQDEKE